MKIRFTVLATFLAFFLFINPVAKSFASTLEQDMNKAIYSAVGEAVAQVIEEKSGVPASSTGSIVGYFSAGDFKDGFLEILKLASDTAISAIPVVGPIKFVASLETSLIKVWKSWLDWTQISVLWNKFKTLSDTEKEMWLSGKEEIAVLDYSSQAAYLERNGYNVKELFRKYYESEKSSKKILEAVQKITEILKDAKYLIEPTLYYPYKSGEKVKLNTAIKIWRSYNNYFKIDIFLPDGKSSSIIKKFSDSENTFSFKLTEFQGIDWNSYFEKYPEGVNVNFTIYAAIWDNTGLIEQFMGSDFVTPKEKILRNIPGQKKQLVTLKFNLVVVSDNQKKSFQISAGGDLYFKYKLVVVGVNEQSGSDSIYFTDTFKITCSQDGSSFAVDSDGIKWNTTCYFDDDSNVSKIALSATYGPLTAYIDFNINGSSCSSSLYTTGVYKSPPENIAGEDGTTYTYYGEFYDFKSTPSCSIN